MQVFVNVGLQAKAWVSNPNPEGGSCDAVLRVGLAVVRCKCYSILHILHILHILRIKMLRRT